MSKNTFRYQYVAPKNKDTAQNEEIKKIRNKYLPHLPLDKKQKEKAIQTALLLLVGLLAFSTVSCFLTTLFSEND